MKHRDERHSETQDNPKRGDRIEKARWLLAAWFICESRQSASLELACMGL
jgi:hypothetical protein